MRLLERGRDGNLCMTRDLFGDNIPPYAILSHTWGSDTEEVSFKDFREGSVEKPGYDKIRFCGEQANRDGLQFFWVDTCCIDKTNSTELYEAINSMFRWYRQAKKCYVYLKDVGNTRGRSWQEDFRRSRWFTRGWTLQELIASTTVEFFTGGGVKLGSKESLESEIQSITGIPVEALRGHDLSGFSVQERMSWIEKRETARKEDKAYSLLGIFGVYMPLIYGEGMDNAFKRLREEIDKSLQVHPALPERSIAALKSPFPITQRAKPPRKHRHESLANPRRSLRLLKIFSSSPDNPRIECELVVSEIDMKQKTTIEKYEVLSHTGNDTPSAYINIRKGQKIYAKYLQPDLVHALHALRNSRKDRYLWVDAICVDQSDYLEKNCQIELMADIYGAAQRVCVWLGEDDASSKTAIAFIKSHVLAFLPFDDLCNTPRASENWSALCNFMQRPWFTKRWAVQEIALAQNVLLYCGDDNIAWSDFAMAVEYLKEMEKHTPCLHEVIDLGEYQISAWFEHISALRATLLIDAVGKVFHGCTSHTTISYDPGSDPDSADSSESEFEGDGSDAAYVSEHAASSDSDAGSENEAPEKPNIPSAMVKGKQRVRAPGNSNPNSLKVNRTRQPLLSLEYLVSTLSIFETNSCYDVIYSVLALARDAKPVASDERFGVLSDCKYPILEAFLPNKQYKVKYQKPFVDIAGNFVNFCIKESTFTDKTRALDILCRPWAPEQLSRDGPLAKESRGTKPESVRTEHEFPLPSWISRVSGASHSFWTHPGFSTLKLGRKNADSLVGLPGPTQRRYSAAGTKAIDFNTLRFRKRAGLGHYSLFAKGFELDTVNEVYNQAHGGAIPAQWVEAADWHNAPETAPPDAFWRTLVANRGSDGGKPPGYYSRACQETFLKGGLRSGSVNTADLIRNEPCSISARFCRRVQEVIWNKVLVRTWRGNLGLVGSNVQVGDKICILYGCSVPVVLRRSSTEKSYQDIDSEIIADVRELFNTFRLKIQDRRMRVALFRQRRREEKEKYSEWERGKRRLWLNDQEWRSAWKQSRTRALEAMFGARYNMLVEEKGAKETWVQWALQTDHEMAALVKMQKIDNSELEMYHSLLQLRRPKSPWKVDEAWWKMWQVWRLKRLALLGLDPSLLSSRNSKGVCDRMYDFHLWRMGYSKLTAPEDREFNAWKTENRVLWAKDRPNMWNELSFNCGEFQLFLKYGRRWKKRWQKSKTIVEDDHYALVYACPFCRTEFTSKQYGHFRSHIMKVHPKCEFCGSIWVNEEDIEIHIHDKHPKVKLRICTTSIPEHADSYNQGFQALCNQQDAYENDDDNPFDPDYEYVHDRYITKEEVQSAWEGIHERRLKTWIKKEQKDYYSPYSYEFLGECYIHGMMDGEAIAVQNNEELKTEIFELR